MKIFAEQCTVKSRKKKITLLNKRPNENRNYHFLRFNILNISRSKRGSDFLMASKTSFSFKVIYDGLG